MTVAGLVFLVVQQRKRSQMLDRRNHPPFGIKAYPRCRTHRVISTYPMPFDYTIIRARPNDLKLLAGIELAAARMLAGHAPESVLNETTSKEELLTAQRHGHLWVALVRDLPVGFAHVKVFEPSVVHLQEIDVHPEHGRRGIGTHLVKTVCDWATVNGYRNVTLTTFRDVPWNRPFYMRVGFEEVPSSELTPELLSVIEDEVRRGLDPHSRLAMRFVIRS
jgi:GNAT superfamily N-acetyltransferase